jgi:hypothetical protein
MVSSGGDYLQDNGVCMKRIDIVGQNGNDGLHYEPDDGQLTDEQYRKIKEYEYELDKSTGEVVKKYTHEQMVDKMLQNPEVLREYVRLINNGEFKKVSKE